MEKDLETILLNSYQIKLREPVGKVLSEVNQQLPIMLEDKLQVAVIVAIMFIILFKIIGLRYAVT